MALYTINVIGIDDEEVTVECKHDQYLLDAMEDADMNVLYSCRAGACSTCCGKILNGSADQEEQSFLDEDQMQAGYCLTCVSYPTSDMTIKLGAEEELF